jgi:hypothetical protein
MAPLEELIEPGNHIFEHTFDYATALRQENLTGSVLPDPAAGWIGSPHG